MPKTVADPTRIKLLRTYPSREKSSKTEDWAQPLWDYVRANVPFQVQVSAIRDDALAEMLHERFVNYVYSRLVVTGCYALGQLPPPDPEVDQAAQREQALQAAVESVLDVIPEIRDRMVYYLERICPRVLGKKAELSKPQRNAVIRMAVEQGHRCYLCGRDLHFPKVRPFGKDGENEEQEKRIAEIRKKRTFTIEHLWSQARGGSRDRTNLAACCFECNNLKKHLISFADVALEQIITTATEGDSLLADMPAMSRLAVLLRQGGCCELCERKLHDLDAEALFLARREPDQPFFFLNIMFVCPDCNQSNELNGVQMRA